MAAIPIRSVSNYDSSLKISLLNAQKSFEDEETFKIMDSAFSNQKIPKSVESFPLKKVFKCGTAENLSKKTKNIASLTSKENLYLEDHIKLEELSHVRSVCNMHLLDSEEENEDITTTTLNKLECLMTSSQKKICHLGASAFELAYPDEADTREVLTKENALKLLKVLFHDNYLFWNVDEATLISVLPYIFLKKFKAQSPILSEGETPSNFFIVQSGIVRKMKNGYKSQKFLEKGKMFGEKSLFDQVKRTSSYVAESNCLLWGINIATFFKLLTTSNTENYNENRAFVNKISIFQVVDGPTRDQIALNLSEQKFHKIRDYNRKRKCVCLLLYSEKRGINYEEFRQKN